MTPAKTEVIQLRIEPELKAKAKQLAEAEGRSLSNWIARLIEEKVELASKGQR